MHTIINFFKRLFSALTKQRKSGFSLIELLVVIGIIGVLAAVAIPAYQKYQTTAAQNTLTTTINNVGKAHVACGVLKENCWTLGDIQVVCPGCMVSAAMAYPWCVSAVNGDSKICLNLSMRDANPNVINNWEAPTCANISSEWNCASASWTEKSGASCSDLAAGCTAGTTPSLSSGSCPTSTTAYVPCSGTATGPAQGVCITAAGRCQ